MAYKTIKIFTGTIEAIEKKSFISECTDENEDRYFIEFKNEKIRDRDKKHLTVGMPFRFYIFYDKETDRSKSVFRFCIFGRWTKEQIDRINKKAIQMFKKLNIKTQIVQEGKTYYTDKNS